MPQGTTSGWYDSPIPPEVFESPAADLAAERGGWKITDDSAAAWAMAKVAEIAAEMTELELQYAAWRENLARHQDQRLAPLERNRTFFEGHLNEYLRRRREESGVKTLDLPSGRVTSRAHGATIAVANEEAFLAWAETAQRQSLCRLTPKPDLPTIRQQLEAKDEAVIDPYSGEVVPGLVVKAPSVSYRVEPR